MGIVGPTGRAVATTAAKQVAKEAPEQVVKTGTKAVTVLTPEQQATKARLMGRELAPEETLDRPIYTVQPGLVESMPAIRDTQAHLFNPGVQDMYKLIADNPGYQRQYLGTMTPSEFDINIEPFSKTDRAGLVAEHQANIVDGNALDSYVIIQGIIDAEGAVVFKSADGHAVMQVLGQADPDTPVPVIFELEPLSEVAKDAVPMRFVSPEHPSLNVVDREMFNIPFFQPARKKLVRKAQADPFASTARLYQAHNNEEMADIVTEQFKPERAAFQAVASSTFASQKGSADIGSIHLGDFEAALRDTLATPGERTSAKTLYETILGGIHTKQQDALTENIALVAEMDLLLSQMDKIGARSLYTRDLFGDTAEHSNWPLIITRVERQQASDPRRSVMKLEDGTFVADVYPIEMGPHRTMARATSDSFRNPAGRQHNAIKLFKETEAKFKEAFPSSDMEAIFKHAYFDAVTFSSNGILKRANFDVQEFENGVLRRLQKTARLGGPEGVVDQGIARIWANDLAEAHKSGAQEVERSAISLHKRAYITKDLGYFVPGRVAEEMLLDPQFQPYRAELEHISREAGLIGAGTQPGYAQNSARVGAILEERGYDHILYINAAENPGIPSMVAWRQDNYMELSANTPTGYTLENYWRLVSGIFGIGVGAEALLGKEAEAAGNEPAGQVEAGNIDLTNRPQVTQPDDSIATIKSKSFNIDGVEVLLPTIAPDGRSLSDEEAIERFKKTGKHLGKFKTPAQATAFAKALSKSQGKALKDNK